MKEIKQFIAAKGFINYQGKILIIRESKNYQDGSNFGDYDVPGGRIPAGQNFQESLIREIKEETDLNIDVKKPFFVNEWKIEKQTEIWQVIAVYFKCEAKNNAMTLSQDHDDFKWINAKDYNQFTLNGGLKNVFKAYLNE